MTSQELSLCVYSGLGGGQSAGDGPAEPGGDGWHTLHSHLPVSPPSVHDLSLSSAGWQDREIRAHRPRD